MVRRCVFGCCIERENVVRVRSPAVHQPPTHTRTNQLPQISFQVGRSVLLHRINYSGTLFFLVRIRGQGGNARNLFHLISNKHQPNYFAFQVPSIPMFQSRLGELRHALTHNTEANTHSTHAHRTPPVAVTKESLYHVCCCAVTVKRTELGGVCVPRM